jgi:modulator of FtsH protease
MLNKFQSSVSSPSMFGAQGSVLRNTYLLLALTLLPTIAGAVIGMKWGAAGLFNSKLIGFIVFLGVAWGFMYAIEKYKNSAAGVYILLGFTFFMGIMLSGILTRIMAFSNGADLIVMAIGGTSLILFCLGAIAATSKRDFSSYGKWAFIALLVIIAASIANIFLKMPLLHVVISIAAMIVFSAFLVYDVQKVVNGGESNYISATLSIYLDVYNIFTNMLSLLGLGFGKDD